MFKIYGEPESPNEEACLSYMMHPKRFEAESLNPKVESGGQVVTPKFGCEVTQDGADSPWLSDPGFWWPRDFGTDNRVLLLKYTENERFPMKPSRNQRFSYINTTGLLRPV